MTVIVGYVDEDAKKMYIAGDTLVTNSDYTKYHVDTKLQRIELIPEDDSQTLIMGYAGSLAPIQYVKNKIDLENIYSVPKNLLQLVYFP